MALVHGGTRTVASVSRHLGRAGMSVLHGVDRAVSTARPAYEAARPLLKHYGVNTNMPDKVLSSYDGLRRAIGK